ncbi:ribbon-helix-helix protein, CopG family [Sinorhizobium meliloti]|uniref:ribbon-helix-helix protein, CopG family n=2 Tax=Rhizobium meliloti TaxID=382 RepID=UPI00307D1966
MKFQVAELYNLRESGESVFPVTMTQIERTGTRERVSAHRERLRAAGRIYVNTDLPADLVECLDKIKTQRGAASRAQLVEEALRLFIEKETRA